MEKNCFKCGELKPLTDFYKHKAMSDGYLNKCKICAKRDSNTNRQNNIERCREYDRNRPNKAERYQKIKEYQQTEKGKEVRRKSTQKYQQDRLKKQAHTDLSNAVKYGKIIKPNNCQNCGVTCKPHGHHDDYSKSLDVRWLCVKCHVDFHKFVRAKQRELEKQNLGDIINLQKLMKHIAKTYWK